MPQGHHQQVALAAVETVALYPSSAWWAPVVDWNAMRNAMARRVVPGSHAGQQRTRRVGKCERRRRQPHERVCARGHGCFLGG